MNEVAQASQEEVEHALLQNVAQGLVEVTNINGEDHFQITKKGLKNTRKLLKDNPEAQLYLFLLLLRVFKKAKVGWRESVLKANQIMEENYNPEFYKLLKTRLLVRPKAETKFRKLKRGDG